MPRKETLKERLREESIWIMFILFFGFIFMLNTFSAVKELNYRINGIRVQAEYIEKSGYAVFTARNGEEIRISVSDFIVPKGTKDRVTMYYFEGEEDNAIILSDFRWWLLVYSVTLVFLVWSARMLYKNFRKSRIISNVNLYEKKKTYSKDIGESFKNNLPAYNKDIYERHIMAGRGDIVELKRKYFKNDEEQKRYEKIVNEQEKIWKVGRIYLGVCMQETLENGITQVAYTLSEKYISDPLKFATEVNNNTIEKDGNVFFADALVDTNKLPYLGKGNTFYLVLAQPGMTESVVLLPRWYYSREELENF